MFIENGIRLHAKNHFGKGILMKVLICDDDVNFAHLLDEKLRGIFFGTERQVKIDCVTTPAVLSNKALSAYDLAFLDIDMGSVNGIDLARKLRTVRQDTVLIFVTNFVEYSLEGYEVQAFRYLLKSELDDKLEKYVRQALSVYQRGRNLIRLNCEGEEYDIPPQFLIYVETASRRLVLHLCDMDREMIQTRTTMTKLSELLAQQGFLRIHKSYLVNMSYIQKLQSTSATLKNGTTLPVSAHNYREIKKAYLQWRGQRRWSIF